MSGEERRQRGVLAWFAENGVAANLLMALIVLGGGMSLWRIPKEVFPEIPYSLVTVSVAYLGAAPEEVEEAVCARIEERVQDLEAVQRIRSVAAEGKGTVTIELLPGADVRRALDDVKSRVDAIDTFPAETEKPIIQQVTVRKQVLSVVVAGEAGERVLRHLAEQLRDEISALPGVTQVKLAGVRPYEISIEVAEQTLRRYGLTFDDVATAVRRSSLDLPGGSVKTRGGEVLLRVDSQAKRGRELEELVLLARGDGTRLTLGEVAAVVDGFADADGAARFDGKPAVLIQVFRVGDQDVTRIAERTRAFVEAARQRLPPGLELTVWQDDSQLLRSRFDTLLRNGRAGLVLVLLVLALFLAPRLAAWVAVGIVVSFLGAFWLMPVLDVTINVHSLFAFLIVLGIVVDDAIVVGENVYRHREMGKSGVRAAIDGVEEVAAPVVFSVLTTVAAFTPLLLIKGEIGQVMRIIPLIVLGTLAVSLVEALLILPCHLAHLPRPASGRGRWTRLQRFTSSLFDLAVERLYRPVLRRALEWRYVTLALAVSLLLLTLGLLAGGRFRFSFFPPAEGDNLIAFLTMPQGTPPEVTGRALARLEHGARLLRQETAAAGGEKAGGEGVIGHVLTFVGEQPSRGAQDRIRSLSAGSTSHLGEINVELAPADERRISAAELKQRWRELSGPIPDAVELSFDAALFSAGKAIDVQLAGPRLADLRLAAADLKLALAGYPGVLDVTDSFRPGKQEVTLALRSQAEALGLSLADLARQVRQAFYGEEAQRVQRGRDELKVMVRYPAAERRSLGDLERMRIRTAAGDAVPFSAVAEVERRRGAAAIERTDRQRTLRVTADVDPAKGNSQQILADVERRVLPEILARYRGVSSSFEGEQQQQRETLGGLLRGFLIALFLIYALLAVPFRSYLQPLIVMGVIPFGVIGAVWGHVLIGKELTVISLFGIVALTGVVVNDSLILVDFVNRRVREGQPLREAVTRAGEERFRPIVLTSLTTFAGLLPLLLERSYQAQFVIPMAVSLAFGVLFATVLTLVLVPAAYLILADLTLAVLTRLPSAARSPRSADSR